MPGVFQKTKVVTILPRFVVVSGLPWPVEVLPVYEDRRGLHRGGVRTHAYASYLPETECYSTLAPSQNLALYSFLPAEHLPPGIRLLPRGEGAIEARLRQVEGLRCICLRYREPGAVEPAGFYGSLSSSAFSYPVAIEDVGETCVWLWRDDAGRRKGPMVSIAVTVRDATVFVSLKEVTSKPPYRIENRWGPHW
jgi:hypothetical protein